jgi:hypothetical protein
MVQVTHRFSTKAQPVFSRSGARQWVGPRTGAGFSAWEAVSIPFNTRIWSYYFHAMIHLSKF